MNIPFAPYIVALVFALAVGTTLGGALIAVLTSRLIRAVCGLMICCLGLAGLYYFLNSPFLALMEILIYVGAVCVTIVFAVMLAEPDEPKRIAGVRGRVWTGLTVGVAALIGLSLARLSVQGPWPALPATLGSDGSIAAIGRALLTTYSLAFEVVSVLLLLAILGALVIARTGRAAVKTKGARPSQPAVRPVTEPEPVLAGK
jgi:NADH:ubiquinone oxidoreductase subunit 6 (subunit J)